MERFAGLNVAFFIVFKSTAKVFPKAPLFNYTK